MTVIGLVGCGSTEVVTPPATAGQLPTPSSLANPPSSAQPTATAAPAGSGSPESPSPTAAASPLASATPDVPGTPFTGTVWRAASDFPRNGAYEVTSVTATGIGFVAVGFTSMPGEDILGRHQGIVWTSLDGSAWQPSVDLSLQFVTPEHIVSLGDALFLFGTLATCNLDLDAACVEPPEAGWAVWRSAGGGAWERLPQLSSMQDGVVDGAVAANGQLMAYGWTGAEAEATLWSSPDGVTWTQTSDLADMDTMTALAGTTAGLAAFGTMANERGNLVTIAAASQDGAQFGTVDAPNMTETVIDSIATASDGSGVVAVGYAQSDRGDKAIALTSTSGLAWAQGDALDDSFADGAPRFVFGVPSGYVAVGVVPGANGPDAVTGTSWSSDGGAGWVSLETFGDVFSDISAAAYGAAGVVIFTVTQSASDASASSIPAAWYAPHEAFLGN